LQLKIILIIFLWTIEENREVRMKNKSWGVWIGRKEREQSWFRMSLWIESKRGWSKAKVISE